MTVMDVTDRHLMWAWHNITHPNPPSHCFLSLCLCVSASLCPCVSLCLCGSVSLCLCACVSVCLRVLACAPCGLVHVCPVCPLGVPLWPWVSLCAPGCLCTPGCLWCLRAPADPLCPTVLPPHCATLASVLVYPTVALCPLGRLYPL